MALSAFRDSIRDLPADLFRVQRISFLLGKLCIVAAIFFALKTGEAFRALSDLHVPHVSLTDESTASAARNPLTAAQYKVISERNLFGTKAPAQAPAQPANVAQLKIRLVGTTIGKRGKTAILEDLNKNEQDVFSVDEDAFGRAKLVEISRESVKVQHNGKIETLALEEGSPTSVTSGGDVAADDSQTDFTVPEEELSQALNNLPLLLSQARAVPYFRNGQSIGMRLFAIRRDSLYEKLGLKNGDILTNVNENSLSDPSQALKLFEQLKNERRIGVKLERNGETKELNYSIR